MKKDKSTGHQDAKKRKDQLVKAKLEYLIELKKLVKTKKQNIPSIFLPSLFFLL